MNVKTRRLGHCLSLSLFVSLLHAMPAWAGDSVQTRHVGARLFADRTAIVPGESIRLAVRLRVEDKWHIYWATGSDPGASALPTTVTLKGPDGFVAGRPMFPPPHAHATEDGALYILEGEPVILLDVHAPSALDSARVTLKVDVSWLVCKGSCEPGDASLDLSLPVVKSAAESKPANEKLFKAAVDALPLASEKASYVKLSGRLSQDRVRPKDKFTAALVVDVKSEHHIQSHKPAKDLVATEVFIEPTDGLTFGLPQYPKAKTRIDPMLGELSEYDSKIEILIPVEAAEKLEGERAPLHGVLRYQACSDKGTCYPAEIVAFNIDIPLAKEGATVVINDLATAPVDAPPTAEVKPAAGAASPAPADSTTWIDALQGRLQQGGIFGYFLLAMLGGFILNFMPCVLPVISLKVLSFVKQAHGAHQSAFPVQVSGSTATATGAPVSAPQARRGNARVFALGLTFSAGIMLSFLALALLTMLAGQGWGSQFQDPRVAIVLAALVTALALSLFGVFSINPPQAVNVVGQKVSGEGFGSALGMGFLATIMGTACTAPFLSVVIALAIKQTFVVGVSIFLFAGLGMSLPYVLLTAKPAWIRFVPRAGPWMETFERIMGFILLGTVLWLVYPLPAQIGGKGLIWTLLFVLFVSFGAWLYGRLKFGDSLPRRLRYWAATAVCVVGGYWLCFHQFNSIAELRREASLTGGAVVDTDWSTRIPWRPYKRIDPREEVRAQVESGKTVFIDYTADWCANCKTNEGTSLNIDSTRELMRAMGVIAYKADYTNYADEIKEDLKRLEKGGVPVYVIYPAGKPDSPIILPEFLTPGIVHAALRNAGPSKGYSLAGEVAAR